MGRDRTRGLRWLQTASDNGVFDASFALAQIYDRGIDVPVDHQRAAHFYQIATNDPGHSTVARQRLGEMVEFGIGIPKDYGKAMALYQGAVSIRRSQWTEFAIGRMYAQGKGVPQNYAKAAEWFLTAADGGAGYGGLVPDAECALAIMYWTGLGTPRDQGRSMFFLNRPNAMNMLACHKLNGDIVKQRVRG
jgi:TPR repeat protein